MNEPCDRIKKMGPGEPDPIGFGLSDRTIFNHDNLRDAIRLKAEALTVQGFGRNLRSTEAKFLFKSGLEDGVFD